MISKFNNVAITGMAAAVPKKVIKNYEYPTVMSDEHMKKVIAKTGVIERRFADDNTCASDLCYASAVNLLSNMNVATSDIDVLIFVSQTPDYRMPATSIILQEKLGLPTSTAAFDISIGCSGYIYGLFTAFSFAQQKGINKVLLLDGETRSKVYSTKDAATSLLFGDGGTATLVEKEDLGTSYFSLNSDGSGESAIKIKGGGYRYPSSFETLKERTYENGSVRNDEQAFMDGHRVFDFVFKKVPEDINKLLRYSKENMDNVDYAVFHQANKYLIKLLAMKLGISMDKVPLSLSKYGNISSVSVPLTMVSELKKQLGSGSNRLLLSGFGVGFSWGSALLNVRDCYVSDLLEI